MITADGAVYLYFSCMAETLEELEAAARVAERVIAIEDRAEWATQINRGRDVLLEEVSRARGAAGT